MYEWTDPDTGVVYQIIYNVTQTDDEGPEHFIFRYSIDHEALGKTWTAWEKLPPFVDPDTMGDIFEHFFGTRHA